MGRLTLRDYSMVLVSLGTYPLCSLHSAARYMNEPKDNNDSNSKCECEWDDDASYSYSIVYYVLGTVCTDSRNVSLSTACTVLLPAGTE